MRTEEKPAHLFERAAARLALQTGDAPGSRTAAVDTIAKLEMRRLSRSSTAEAEPSASINRAVAPITAEALARVGMIDRAHRRARIAEEFRIVQNKLLREAFGGNSVAASPRGNVVLVTSALQAEGKSFVSINLASGVARQGDRRVLLIDTDVKAASLGQLLGASTLPGILDLARSGDPNIEELIVPTAADNLDFLPLGSAVERSAEIFASKRMSEVLDGLSRRYPDRLIILDSSPCLASSNPHALAPVVGQIVLVVAAGRTQQGDVEAALDLIRHCPLVSLLLNKIAPWNVHSFGSYSYPPSA